MNKLTIFCFIGLFASCSSYQKIHITPQSTVTVPTRDNHDYSRIMLHNKSMQELRASIYSTATDTSTGGFGINKLAKIELTLNKSQQLKITNPTNTKVKLSYISYKADAPKQTDNDYVSFTLHNSSAKSIPLIIPGVMNPNLSPISNNGVDLKVGQEILFKQKGKTYVLLTVDNSYANKKVDVAKILRLRKEELGI